MISTLPGQTLGSEGLQVSFSLSNIHMPRMWVENHPDKDSQVKKWSLHWLLHSKINTFHLTLPDSNELWCGSDACRPACWCFIQTLSQAGCPAREVRPVWAMWSFFWTPPGRCGETPCWTPAGLPFKSSISGPLNEDQHHLFQHWLVEVFTGPLGSENSRFDPRPKRVRVHNFYECLGLYL